MGLSKVEPQCQAAAAVRLVVEGTLENSLPQYFSPHNSQPPPLQPSTTIKAKCTGKSCHLYCRRLALHIAAELQGSPSMRSPWSQHEVEYDSNHDSSIDNEGVFDAAASIKFHLTDELIAQCLSQCLGGAFD
jgi:hypothetical protein